MGITTNALTKVSIGTTTAKTDATGYASDTWQLIGNVTDVGEAGSESEIITAKIVGGDGFTRKLKGSRDNGTLELTVIRDSADPGYIALIAAEKSSFGYNFQIELNDKPSAGASPKNSKFYFNALVMSAKNSFNDADNIITTVFSLAISGPIVEVAASAT